MNEACDMPMSSVAPHEQFGCSTMLKWALKYNVSNVCSLFTHPVWSRHYFFAQPDSLLQFYFCTAPVLEKELYYFGMEEKIFDFMNNSLNHLGWH